MGTVDLVTLQVYGEFCRGIRVAGAPCLVVDDLALETIMRIDKSYDRIERLQLGFRIVLGTAAMNKLDSDRVRIHAVVARPAMTWSRTHAIIAQLVFDAIELVMAVIAIASMMRDDIEGNALDNPAIAPDHKMSRDAISGSIPPIHNRLRRSGALGIVDNDVALKFCRFGTMLE